MKDHMDPSPRKERGDSGFQEKSMKSMTKISGTPIEPGVVARLGRRLRDTIDVWFGPDQPQPISAPAGTPPRTTDYPVSYNIQIQPRNLETISFAQMRGLADSFDLVRLCVE